MWASVSFSLDTYQNIQELDPLPCEPRYETCPPPFVTDSFVLGSLVP